jgi:hypothetical protein
MEEELDEDGDMPLELGNWDQFQDYFKGQWYDSGSVINARKKWKKGFIQTGSAKEYFALIELLIVKLRYNKNSREVIDTTFEGLKPHIRTHFALEAWADFATMKGSTCAYDEAYFAQNRKDPKDFKGKGKEKRFQKTETAAMGSGSGLGSGMKRLSDEDWEMCKVKGFCFVCKKIGKDVLGLAKEHPNHPPKGKKVEDPKTKKVDSKTGFRKKTANVKAMDADMDSDVDKTQNEDSDSEEQAKN